MNSIVIDDEGKFTALGKLKTKKPSTAQFGALIQSAIEAYHVMGEAYENFMAGDQKLIGQEKASIKLVLEAMTNQLITLRFHLEEVHLEGRIPSTENYEEGFSFSMHLDDFDYTITGELSVKTYDSFHTFRDWHSDVFSDRLKKFLADLKVALKDKKLDKDEVEWLNRRLDAMIHLQLIMHYKLDHARLET